MTDLGATIAPKSDQLNSDDLISGPITIKITKVTGNPGSPEQPVSIFFDGDNGKPYKPCKSMRRVLVQIWGRDGATYPGRSMTLYREPTVKFGGMEVGGIRISHMTHIDGAVTMALTASKASRKPYTVRPLAIPTVPDSGAYVARVEKAIADATDAAALGTWWNSPEEKAARKESGLSSDQIKELVQRVTARINELKEVGNGN